MTTARSNGFGRCFARSSHDSLAESKASNLPDTTPGVTATHDCRRRATSSSAACDDFLIREAIAASLTDDERREILRGMILTRAVDNRLKQFFLSGEIKYRDVPFQGKGFRSLGQEAIYAAAIRLKRGPEWRDPQRGWQGDVVGPIIRDVGVALAMRPEPATVRMVLNAQMAKSGPPMDGRDLHIGDWEWGILPATAPLSISTLSIAGIAMAFSREGQERVALSFIGEGGSSLGEWHEAINLCAARRLPAVFCIENNQTALSTSVSEQSAARVFADKAAGYGIPGITIDGTDPDAIAAAFTWAADRARSGAGPALIELVSMRMSGHAHHDDMLFLGKEPPVAWEYPKLSAGAYADPDRYSFWATRDPIQTYARRLEAAGVIGPSDAERYKQEAQRTGRERSASDHRRALAGATGGGPPRVRRRLHTATYRSTRTGLPPCHRPEPGASTGRPGPALRSQGSHVPGCDRSRHRGRPSRQPTRLRLRRGRGRQVRQLVPSAPAAPRRVRRSHHQLTARRGWRARGLHWRGAGRPAAHRRDAVQRLRRERFQSAREQRGQDSLPVGRRGADGDPDAVGRPAACRTVSFAEHGSLVLSNARPEDRRPLDARGRACPDGGGRRRSRSRALLRAHRAVSRSGDQAESSSPPLLHPCHWDDRRFAAAATTSRSSRTAPTCTSHFARQPRSPPRASRPACSTCAHSRRSTALPSLPSPATAAASSSCTRTRAPAASARASPRSFRRRHSSRSTRPCASSAHWTHRFRTRRRSRSTSCRRRAEIEHAARLAGGVLSATVDDAHSRSLSAVRWLTSACGS